MRDLLFENDELKKTVTYLEVCVVCALVHAQVHGVYLARTCALTHALASTRFFRPSHSLLHLSFLSLSSVFLLSFSSRLRYLRLPIPPLLSSLQYRLREEKKNYERRNSGGDRTVPLERSNSYEKSTGMNERRLHRRREGEGRRSVRNYFGQSNR